MNPMWALMSSIGQVAIPAFSHPARGACIISMYFMVSILSWVSRSTRRFSTSTLG